jgi:hypothetical protein
MKPMMMVAMLGWLAGLVPTGAQVTSWSTNNTAAGNATNNFSAAASWSGGFNPASGLGYDAFMVWSRPPAGGPTTKIITNASPDVFNANSLSLTNTGKDHVFLFIKGAVFLTNGTARLGFGGATGAGNLSLQFSNSVNVGAVNFTGSAGTGLATLTFAGALTGGSLTFHGGTGANHLRLAGPVDLSGTLSVSNLNATSAGTLSGNATVGRLFLNNSVNNRFVITNSTTTVTGVAGVSVLRGFTLANDATLTIGSGATAVFSNLLPVLNGTVNVNGGTLTSQLAWTNTAALNLASGRLGGQTFVNAGQVTGNGTITPAVVNSGTLAITVPGVTFDGSVTVTPAGVITATPGSHLRFRGDFINHSTQNTAFDLLDASVTFDGGGATQLFVVAGLDLGATYDGFTNNFAIGTLVIGGGTNAVVALSGAAGRALYVESLTVDSGSVLLLNGLTIYTADPANLAGTVIEGGGMIMLIPEAGSLTLVGCGLALLFMVTRRRR